MTVNDDPLVMVGATYMEKPRGLDVETEMLASPLNVAVTE